LIVEQAVLAGLGVVAGVAAGLGVAAAMGASLVLTPAGTVPLPEPLVTVATGQLAAYSAGLFLLAILLGALVARRARRELATGALRIGED
jgi:ABC-type antimicrobial peptide transport system permease subunit